VISLFLRTTNEIAAKLTGDKDGCIFPRGTTCWHINSIPPFRCDVLFTPPAVPHAKPTAWKLQFPLCCTWSDVCMLEPVGAVVRERRVGGRPSDTCSTGLHSGRCQSEDLSASRAQTRYIASQRNGRAPGSYHFNRWYQFNKTAKPEIRSS
jgi:hypothetical protein